MIGTIARLLLALTVIMAIAACDEQGELGGNERLENRLIKSFANEEAQLQQHVALIVQQAREENYAEAMNRLALLSATRQLTGQQKQIVNGLVKQYRFDMEEKILPASNGENDE